MKKTISRAFSLFLVLAILVGVMPAVLAASSVEISPKSAKVKVDATTSFSAQPTEEKTGDTYAWSITTGSDKAQITEGAAAQTVTVKGVAAGQATLQLTYTPDGGTAVIKTATITVETADPVVPAQGTLSFDKQSMELAYNDTTTLTAKYTPAGAEETPTITYSGTNDFVKVDDDGSIKALMAGGSATVTAKAGEGVTAEITINTVKKEISPTITGVPTGNTMNIGAEATLGIKFGDTELAATSVTWSSEHEDVVKVEDDGKITALKNGSSVITAKVKLVNANYVLADATNDEVDVKVTITVSATAISLGNYTTAMARGSNTSIIITPTVNENTLPSGASKDQITFKAAAANSTGNATAAASVSNDGKIVVSSPKGEGTVKVTITAEYNGKEVGSAVAIIGVYGEYEIRGTLSASASRTFYFEDEVFSTLTVNGTPWTKSLSAALRGTGYVDLTLTPNTTNEYMTFSKTEGITLTGLDNVKVTCTGSAGTQRVGFEWVGEGGVLVAKGTMYLTVGATEGDIVYSTSYNEKVIFDASDFTSFFNAQVKAGNISGTFSYVKFEDINTGVYPKYGMLYRETSCSNRVLTNYKFVASSSSNVEGAYLLDNVTYKPDSALTNPYYVQIPFTVYNTSGKSVAGMIEIRINYEGTGIYATGIKFGSGSSTVDSLAEQIAATYKANTGNTLGYVTFPSLSASTGKLFYDYDGILGSKRVSSTYKFYADPTSTQNDLDDVMFVPRAGLYGDVSISYKAYNINGGTEYEGTLLLNVVQKTKSSQFSDVNANSYKWAADSVDFLYVEEVANGTSSSKYSPASSIKRGDFMLMLYRAFLEEDYDDYNVTTNFSDMTKGTTDYTKETYQAVGVAKALGIAQGTGGKFNPNNYITRQEAMALIYRTLDEVNYSLSYSVSTDTSDFKDYSSVASYAKTAISYLIEHGIVIGSNDKINPKSNINRAEMAVILHRVLTY